jgi:hypothetical protein
VCPAAKRAPDAQLYVDQLIQGGDPAITQAYTLSQAFLALVRERRGHALETWITETAASGIEVLARFAQGLREDLAAVTAGLTLPWSNGPVEGHVNRLKLLKRQGYGRAGFALLRHRVLLPVVGGPGAQAPTTTTPACVSPRGQQETDVGELLRAA